MTVSIAGGFRWLFMLGRSFDFPASYGDLLKVNCRDYNNPVNDREVGYLFTPDGWLIKMNLAGSYLNCSPGGR